MIKNLRVLVKKTTQIVVFIQRKTNLPTLQSRQTDRLQINGEDFFVGLGIFFSNFVGSESGHIKIVKLLQIMVSNTTHHPLPPHTGGELGGNNAADQILE